MDFEQAGDMVRSQSNERYSNKAHKTDWKSELKGQEELEGVLMVDTIVVEGNGRQNTDCRILQNLT